MDLPNLLNKLKTTPPPAKQFVAIEVSPSAVKSAIWQVQGETTSVISFGSVQVWDTQSETDLLSALDLSLADAYAGTPEEPNEVIFGLPETWVNGDNIAEAKKPLIKTICQKLALKPVGFVVTLEAIVHHLQTKAGSPPSAVLLNIAPEELVVSLVSLGVIEGTQVVGRSSDLCADVEEGLARFPKHNNFPSRMVLFDAREDLEAAKQALIDHDWQAKLPFLHIPKIESLSKDVTIEAVAIAGGTEVAASLGLTAVIQTPPLSEPPPVITPPTDSVDNLTPSQEIPDLSTTFGFDSDALANDSQPQIVQPPSSIPPPPPPPTPETQAVPPSPHLHRFPTRLSALGGKISGLFHRPARSLKIKNHPPRPARSQLIIGLMILIGLGVVLVYWFIPKAEVTIFVSQKPVDQEITFTLDSQTTTADLTNQVIPVTLDTVTVSGTQTSSTTGTKTIGEKAKGKVALYNRTTSPKSFPEGTILTTKDLKYTLNEAVSLASASAKENADFSITIEPAKVEVALTASAIGDPSNVPANTQFTVANFGEDSYIANATTPISGGYSEQVQVVSETDATKLKAELVTELESQVKAQVADRSGGTQGTIPTEQVEITQEEYSASVGEAASQLTLSLTMEQVVYVYSTDDVALMTEALVQDKIPSDYTVNAAATQVQVVDTAINEDNTATITAKINLMLMPKIDTATVAQELAGKSPAAAQAYLSTLPGYLKAEIVQTPGFVPTLPLRAEKITPTVKPQSSI